MQYVQMVKIIVLFAIISAQGQIQTYGKGGHNELRHYIVTGLVRPKKKSHGQLTTSTLSLIKYKKNP